MLRTFWRFWVWALDLDDGQGNGQPSLTKWLALVFGLTVVISILFSLSVTGTQVTLAIVSISAAFGRSVWRHFLASKTFTLTASDAKVRTEIVERRDTAEGVEPSP